jgi:hypothetical protein
MSRTYYFPKTQAKKLGSHEKDLKKSNYMLLNLDNYKKKGKAKNLSYNNGKDRSKDYLYIMYATTHKNFYNFKKSLSKK